MTSAIPRDEDEGPDRDHQPVEPVGRDIDRAFDLIVSGIKEEMNWDTSSLPDIDTPEPAGPPDMLGGPTPEEAERARRRRERAEQLALFQQQKAEEEASYLADDGQFVKPEPGPLPKLRPSTVTALVLILAGLALFIAPTLLVVPQDLTMIIAASLIVGGGAWLVSKLRKEPGPDEDFDNGARL